VGHHGLGGEASNSEATDQAFAMAIVICEVAGREVRRLRANDELAREISQTLARRFLDGRPHLENVVAWTRVSARRELRDLRRSRARFVSLSTIPEPFEEGGQVPFERRDDLRRVLGELRPSDRDLIQAVLEGLGHLAIAERFGWSVGQVGTRIRRATERAKALWILLSDVSRSSHSTGPS
jgi:DNA-directed RNA polymerase specialized sigma24 family protein